jgi:hypothetical protein
MSPEVKDLLDKLMPVAADSADNAIDVEVAAQPGAHGNDIATAEDRERNRRTLLQRTRWRERSSHARKRY